MNLYIVPKHAAARIARLFLHRSHHTRSFGRGPPLGDEPRRMLEILGPIENLEESADGRIRTGSHPDTHARRHRHTHIHTRRKT